MAPSRTASSPARRPAWAAALAAAVILAGCGAASTTPRAGGEPPPRAFAWLRPGAAPAGWKLVRLPSSGATLAYPPGWHAIHTDAGTASVALLGRRHRIVGYLNATPRQGTEALAGWPGFRTRHIRAEGSREVRTAARATGLRFRTGVGSCVLDDYRNAATRYREVACIVQGTRATTVVVGAAPAALWARQARVIRPAIASLRT